MCLRLLFFCVCIYVKEHSNLFCSNLYVILCENIQKKSVIVYNSIHNILIRSGGGGIKKDNF